MLKPFSDISFTLHTDTVRERKIKAALNLAKLWLTIKTWIKMYSNNIFIQDSKSESDWNVSVNLGFVVLCLFVLLLLLLLFFFSWLLAFRIDERASKQDFRQLSLLFPGNHYNWVFSKTFFFPIANDQKINLSLCKLISNARPLKSSVCLNSLIQHVMTWNNYAWLTSKLKRDKNCNNYSG